MSENSILAIETLRMIEGKHKPRTLGLVIESASQHQSALMDDWQFARSMQPLKSIPPLE